MGIWLGKIEDKNREVKSIVFSSSLLAYSIVKLYIEEYGPASIAELMAAFPQSETGWGYGNLHGNNFFLTENQFISSKQFNKELKYYEKPIPFGPFKLYVTTQYWTKGPGQAVYEKFVNFVEKKYNYKITGYDLGVPEEMELAKQDLDLKTFAAIAIKVGLKDLEGFINCPDNVPLTVNMRTQDFYEYLLAKNISDANNVIDKTVEIYNRIMDGADLDLVSYFVAFRDKILKYVKQIFLNNGVQNVSEYTDALRYYFDFFDDTYEICEVEKIVNGVAQISANLRKLDITPYVDYQYYYNPNLRIDYGPNVVQSNHVPGLKDFTKAEISILKTYAEKGIFNSFNIFKQDFSLPNIILTDEEITETVTINRIGISHKYLKESVLFLIKVLSPNPGTLLDNLREKISLGCKFNLVTVAKVLDCDEIRRSIDPWHFELFRYLLFLPSENSYSYTASYSTLGYYNKNDRTITMCYCSIKDNMGIEHYLAQFRNVLAHEFLHHLQNINECKLFGNQAGGDCWKQNMYLSEDMPPHNPEVPINHDFARNIISEAQADFFAMVYSVDNAFCQTKSLHNSNTLVAQERYNLWKQTLEDEWPYAYALYFMIKYGKQVIEFSQNINDYNANDCVRKYADVWRKSQRNVLEAYYTLIYR